MLLSSPVPYCRVAAPPLLLSHLTLLLLSPAFSGTLTHVRRPTGVAAARDELAGAPHAAVAVGDFFAADADAGGPDGAAAAMADGSFDLVYECTFLCAIPPELHLGRAVWAREERGRGCVRSVRRA